MHHRDIIDSWLCVTVELCVTSVCYVEGLGHNRFQHSSPLQNTRTVALIRTYHQMFHWHRCELTVEVSSPDEAATHLQNRMLLKYIKNETLLFFSFVCTNSNTTNDSNINRHVLFVHWARRMHDRRRAATQNKALGTVSRIVLQTSAM